MEIERYINDEGECCCFAVDNTKVSRIGMSRMLCALPGVVITKVPKFYDTDIFCEFDYQGSNFFIEEPYGDNATYDVVAPEGGLESFNKIALFFEETAPLKGGDWGYNLMFLLRVIISTLIFTCITAWLL
ncbi:MAG: hypothetical protein MJK04_05935 [Psychrosphaera sp.]|nr:hypothetical protein [Psychrosphaera sp.]